jgi:hypothetical protein
MSVIYNTQYVDEKYLSIIEPNLYYGSVLQPGITFTDKYESQAGGIFIHKLGGGKDTGVTPGTPGRDFTDEVVADSLIQAVFNNNFQKSRKIYGVTAAAVGYNKKESELAEALKQVSQGWQASGVACMVYEGKNYPVATPITSSTIKAQLIAMRKQLVDDGATPTFAIVSTDVFEAYLTFIGTQYTPSINDTVLAGRSVDFLGMTLIEANILNLSSVKYYNYAGTLKTVDLTEVEIIMGDAEAFSALNNFEMIRVVDSERFSGALAQVETNAAYRVTNAEKLAVKFNTVNSI